MVAPEPEWMQQGLLHLPKEAEGALEKGRFFSWGIASLQ